MSSEVSEIVKNIRYAAIATVDDKGQPWNSPVMVHFDDDLNMYWDSWVKNQHSLNIERNEQIFIVVYDSTKKPGTALRSGVYIQARAHKIEDESEVKRYFELRSHTAPIKREPTYFLNSNPRRVYKAVPEKVWLNDRQDIGDAWIDIREEVVV